MYYYSLYDTDSKRLVRSIMNKDSFKKCVEDSFDYITEDNSCMEVEDWIQAGGSKREAIKMMDYKIIKHNNRYN